MVRTAAPMAITQQDVIVIVCILVATRAAHNVLSSKLFVLVVVFLWDLPMSLHLLALEKAVPHPLHRRH